MAFKRVFKGFKEETTSETEQLDFSLWIYIIKLPPKADLFAEFWCK